MLLWLFVTVLVLAVLVLFCVAPDAGQRGLRAPFVGRNFAHRGLYAQDQSVPENSLPAFEAAARAGYGIELDVQFSADRQLVVFHDDHLDRMTSLKGWVRDHAYSELSKTCLADAPQTIPLFSQVLETVGGRVPLIVEIKSRWGYSSAYLDALCAAVLEALGRYNGSYCIESFDPRVVRRIHKMAPGVLRGQLIDSFEGYRRAGARSIWAYLLSHGFGNFLGRPQFIAWAPQPQNWAIRLCDWMGAMMVYWTARPSADVAALRRRYDGIIFEWYHPRTQYQPRH